MPFGIRSTPQITKAVSESLSDWNAGYSSTDKKVQAIFRKMNWSASSFFNILTFGLDAYLKKRKIREIVKGEVSAFKVAQLSEFFKQRDSENPFEHFQIFNNNEQKLLSQVREVSFDGNPSWKWVKKYFRENLYPAIEIPFLFSLIDSSQKELGALADFLNGKRPTFKKTSLLDAGVKLAAAIRIKPDLLPLLPKKLRKFLGEIESDRRVDEHLIEIVKKNLNHRASSLKQWVSEYVPKLLGYAREHLESDKRDTPHPQFEIDIKRTAANCLLKITHLGEKKKNVSLKYARQDRQARLVSQVTGEFEKIANILGTTEEEKKQAALCLQLCVTQGLYGTKSGEIAFAIQKIALSDLDDSIPSFLGASLETTFEIIHLAPQKVQFKTTSKDTIILGGSRDKTSPLPVIEADFSVLLERTPEGLKITTDL
ncbi:MAG: hypothetical protein A3E80_05220 [Chlamydiae bacterium RIFCSPHIGHO2_12_FULL_49_9]|nr:MAG: hypothetical protein A3E80_05220 [Chlamydiae bacterium RIFCSPHIGHO2_12_FULL_49_9]